MIQRSPTLAALDLMNDLCGSDTNLQRAEALFIALVRNSDFIRLLPVAYHGAGEAIVIQLKEDVVLRVGVIQYPLQDVSLDWHGRKDKGS